MQSPLNDGQICCIIFIVLQMRLMVLLSVSCSATPVLYN